MKIKSGDEAQFDLVADVVGQAYKERNGRGLKMIVQDVNEWARYMPKPYLDELNLQLFEKFRDNLDKKRKAMLKKIAQLLKKGEISSDDEYRIIESRVNEIFQDERTQAELNALNNLLAKYYQYKNGTG